MSGNAIISEGLNLVCLLGEITIVPSMGLGVIAYQRNCLSPVSTRASSDY